MNRRRPRRAATILLLSRVDQDRLHRAVELEQLALVLAAQVELEPRLLGDGVEAVAAADPRDGAAGAWLVGNDEVGEPRRRAAHGIGGIGDAERRPGVAAGAAIGHPVAPRAERAVD